MKIAIKIRTDVHGQTEDLIRAIVLPWSYIRVRRTSQENRAGFRANPGSRFVKFFDPYLYREKIQFASEKEAAEYYVEKLREQIPYEGQDNVAAIFLESVTKQRCHHPTRRYLQGVRKLCDEYGIMMVCDEVLAGWGRTGKWFAFMHWDVKPDMITFARESPAGTAARGSHR
jgi:taurine--2-oxoglutarate transaminase